MNILGIVPARGGSKGIPKKKYSISGGIPLIAHSINFGKSLTERKIISKCVVSTDDDEIAKISKKYGGDVPFLRPKAISGDTSKSIEFVLHAINYFSTKHSVEFDAVLILQPTSPIRNLEQVTNSIRNFMESKSQSMISCYQEEYINDLVSYYRKGKALLEPVDSRHNSGVRRQEIKPKWVRNGSIYLTRTRYILSMNKLICDNPYLLEMSKRDSIDVDTEDDLALLRLII